MDKMLTSGYTFTTMVWLLSSNKEVQRQIETDKVFVVRLEWSADQKPA